MRGGEYLRTYSGGKYNKLNVFQYLIFGHCEPQANASRTHEHSNTEAPFLDRVCTHILHAEGLLFLLTQLGRCRQPFDVEAAQAQEKTRWMADPSQ